MEEKTCPRCGLTKPLSDFGSNVRHTDNHDTYCRQCRRQINRERHGGIARLFAKFSDEELKEEMRRRGLMK